MKNQKSSAGFLIFLCWLVYSVSYLGKVNYSASITKIIEFYDITKAEAGTPPTFFFFAYGIGQVVNGIFCRKYNIKLIVFVSLLTSAVINLAVAVNTNFSVIKWLWLLNGFVLAILWPSLIRLLSENLQQKDLGKSSVVMGTTVAVGTIVIYGLSSLYAYLNNFKLAFYTAAFSGIVVSVFWLFFYKKAVGALNDNKQVKSEKKPAYSDSTEKPRQTENERKILLVSVYILCLCSIGINLIKDGLITWVPSILKEEYRITDSISVLLTLSLPVVAIFGNLFALTVHKKIPDYITHCAVVFAIMFCFIGIIIGSIKFGQVLLMLVGLIVVSFLASSLNSLVTSIFPMLMREKLNSGMYAGVLNGFCYLGSTISAYGLGIIADNFGWTSVFLCLMELCAVICIIWCGYIGYKRMLKGMTAKQKTKI